MWAVSESIIERWTVIVRIIAPTDNRQSTIAIHYKYAPEAIDNSDQATREKVRAIIRP
jgi:hypothetical protein